MDSGLRNKYRLFEEASSYAEFLCAGCEEDELYLKIFVEFVTKVLQRHIGEAYGKKVEARNSRRTIPDENKLRNKAINVIRLSNGKEIRTENVAEINSNAIKAEMNAMHLRAVIEHYKLFCRTFITKDDEKIDELLETVDEFKRDRANLAENVSCNIRVLEENGITNDLLKTIRGYADRFIDCNELSMGINEKEEEELNELAERTIETPYKE
jgi:hypothetical protein